MTSSPHSFEGDAGPSFLTLFTDAHDAGLPSLQSSPLRPNGSSTSYFDPAVASPFNDSPAPSKTPASRLKSMIGGHAFLTSPMNTYTPSLGSSLHASILKQPPGSPLTYRRVSSSADIQVADPLEAPSWNQSDMDGSDQDISTVFMAEPFSSPIQKRISHSVTATPTQPAVRRSPVTPTDQTPRGTTGNASAPSTLTRHQRSLSGLGTPSHIRSPLRPRQVTDDPSLIPVSPSARRNHNNSSSLTTRAPLARAVSHGAFMPPFVQPQDRNVSGASSRTVSTNYELHSPRFGPIAEGHEQHVLNGHAVPDLVASRHYPSPQVSQGHSPLCTPTQPFDVYHYSPDVHQSSLMSGVNQVMGPSSVPNSVSMSSVASFPSNHGYRQSTLGTIAETPIIMQDAMMTQGPGEDMTAPGSYNIPQGPGFQDAEYPPVPGMRASFHGVLPGTTHPANIQAWAAQTIRVDTNIAPHSIYGVTGPVLHPSFQRHTSGPFYTGQPSLPSHMLAPPVSRSISAPHLGAASSMSNMSGMPMSLDTGGLFGPAGGSELRADGGVMLGGPQLGHYGSVGQGGPTVPDSTVASPDTPRKRHPSVGTRLKPGPKPKTPKKARSSSNPVSSPSSGPAGELINFGGALAGPSLLKIDEDKEEHARAGPSKPKALDFGPDLVVSADQRPLSAPTQTGTQPHLTVQPPRATGENAASGLPRSFLEQLYTTFMTTEGSSGQPVKRFRCKIEGCDRTFPRKSAIHSHIQTHLEDKPFRCETEDWYVFDEA